jgi:hypothetical protein
VLGLAPLLPSLSAASTDVHERTGHSGGAGVGARQELGSAAQQRASADAGRKEAGDRLRPAGHRGRDQRNGDGSGVRLVRGLPFHIFPPWLAQKTRWIPTA